MKGDGLQLPFRSQRGVALVLVLVALTALLAMAGLALDAGRLVVNKSRLQATVDAAALAAAKVLDLSGSEAQATAAARANYDANAAQFTALRDAAAVNLTVQYSATLNPFVPGTGPAQYVRVRATNFTFLTSLTRVVGVDTLTTAASAVAGPSPNVVTACNVAPVMVCGVAGAPNFGYTVGEVTALKTSQAQPGTWRVGTGNFQLVDFGSGGAGIRENLAGGYGECLDGGDMATNGIPVQTGNVIGPTADGLNMRFGLRGGGGLSSTTYPPDVITTSPSPTLEYYVPGRPGTPGWVTQEGVYSNTTLVQSSSQLNFNYATYIDQLRTTTPVNGQVAGRRELAVPIGDCSTPVSGSATNVPFLGFGCFFVLQPVQSSNQGGDAYIFGEFINSCAAGGVAGPNPGTGPGPYLIQLYRDFGSADS